MLWYTSFGLFPPFLWWKCVFHTNGPLQLEEYIFTQYELREPYKGQQTIGIICVNLTEVVNTVYLIEFRGVTNPSRRLITIKKKRSIEFSIVLKTSQRFLTRSSSLGTQFANACFLFLNSREHPNFLEYLFIDDRNKCSCISCSKLSLESVLDFL